MGKCECEGVFRVKLNDVKLQRRWEIVQEKESGRALRQNLVYLEGQIKLCTL